MFLFGRTASRTKLQKFPMAFCPLVVPPVFWSFQPYFSLGLLTGLNLAQHILTNNLSPLAGGFSQNSFWLALDPIMFHQNKHQCLPAMLETLWRDWYTFPHLVGCTLVYSFWEKVLYITRYSLFHKTIVPFITR